MLNLSTPILQIKTSGFDLLKIKTMIVSINYPAGSIRKMGGEVEINGDMVAVLLTQDEYGKMKEGGTVIFLSAEDCDNTDVSDRIKVKWAKLSSRPGGTYVSEDVFNQEITGINVKIGDMENGLSIGGNRVYLDYRNGKYGINTDSKRGADTFVPFKSEGDIRGDATFIDSVYDSPANVFSTMTQVGIYNQRVMEINPYWTKLLELDETLFTENFEKITMVIQEV